MYCLGKNEMLLSVFLIVFIILLVKFILQHCKAYFEPYISEQAYECELILNGKKLILNAFLDTGNLLTGENNYPIAVVQLNAIQKLFSKQQWLNIISGESEILNNLHYITYNTIEGKGKKLLVFRPDGFYVKNIKEKNEVKCFVGLSFLPLFKNKNYQVIIGTKMLRS